jgi:hypothetical protein
MKSFLDKVVLAHVIIVIRDRCATVEVAVDRVVQRVDLVIISNNGTVLILVPVEIRGVVIISQVVAVVVVMIVFNNLLVAMVLVKRTKVGGTIRHENQAKTK